MIAPKLGVDMVQPSNDVLFDTGLKALQAGQGEEACAHFQQVIDSGETGTRHWLGLALASLTIGDRERAEKAIDQVLAQEPHHLRALILKGDLLFGRNDPKNASAHYGLALRLSATLSGIPAQLESDLQRIARRQRELMHAYSQHLLDQLALAGYKRSSASDRFNRSIDMMLGTLERPDEQRPHPQAPHAYYMPDLPYHSFFPKQQLSWMNELEAATDRIETELLALLDQQQSRFEPYIHSGIDRPQQAAGDLLDSDQWTSAYLWRDGSEQAPTMDSCPFTTELMASLPLTLIEGFSPSVLFSKLDAGARIKPHTGMVNTRLICHLPLLVPNDCGLRVGGESRTTVRGEAWAFDDSINHEAWNNSDQQRVILLFDVWRPELDNDERHLVKTLLEAVKTFGM